MNRFRNSEKEQEIQKLEALLGDSLAPLEPRPEFVRDLGHSVWVRVSDPDSLPRLARSQQEIRPKLLLAARVAGWVGAAMSMVVLTVWLLRPRQG